MDTSTPVNKRKSHIFPGDLRRKALENDCELNSIVSQSDVHESLEEDAELVYSQRPSDARLNRSEELFPFSPIPFRKEVPSTLLPLLDTPDVKWSSSLFTSFHAPSENASPEVLSENNFVGTICVDSHVDNNARYTNSYFNSEVPGFSNDTNITNVPPQDSYVERNSSRPSPPISVTRKKEKKFSSINKELFPFREANEISREQSPSLECGAMGDMTLNALEQICIDSEIIYSKNSSKKSNTVNTSFADEATSYNIPDSIELSKNDVIPCRNKRSFIYPYDNVKKQATPALVTDILQNVLSLETNETSAKVPKKNKNFCQGLVCFSQLEPSLSQSADNLTFPSPLTVWCDTETENPNGTAATYEIVRVIYLPVFFSSDEMSTSDRDMLTVLKRYLESHRVHFACLISKSRIRARQDLSSTFVDRSRSKFPKLNFSAAIIDSFFEFFILHPNLMYNYRLSRRFCVSSNQSATKKRRTQYFGQETQLSSSLVSQFSTQLDQKSSDVSPNQSNLSFEVPVYPKIDEEEESSTQVNFSCSAALNQNSFVADKHSVSNTPATSNKMEAYCVGSEPKITKEQTDEENKGRTSERPPFLKSTSSNPEKLIQELTATLSLACECNSLDDDLLERAKKLLEDTAKKIKASELRFERSVDKFTSVNSPAANTSVNVSEKSDIHVQNSSDLLSKTPFDVDIDSADLMFICDLSEKTVLPETPLNSDVTPFPKSILKVTETSPQHHKSSKTAMKFSNITAPSTEFSAKNHYSPPRVSKPTPLLWSTFKKCTSKSLSEKLVTSPQRSSHAQTMVLDDIENWNPELAAMMTPIEIKKQLIHTRSSEKDIASSLSNMEGNSLSTNKFAFPAFNTAGGRKINVQPNSLVRAKMSMDAVQVEPETTEKHPLNQRNASGATVLEEKSSSRQLSKPANDVDGLLAQLPANKKTTVKCSSEDSPRKIKFTTGESLNQILEPQDAKSYVDKFSAFNVSEKFSVAGKKIESTAGEKVIDEIKLNRNDSFSRSLPGDSNLSRKIKSPQIKLVGSKTCEPSIFKKPSASPALNKSEVESCHQLGGFCSAAGKKLTVAGNSRNVAEKLYASISNEVSFESAQDLQFASFSSASGKKICVANSLLEKGKKLYESTLEETKLSNSESARKVSFPKSLELSRTVKKMNVTDESWRRAQKLFDDCFDENCTNEFTLNPLDSSLSPHLSTFTSAAGKTINVAEQKLFNAQKIFQSVSAEAAIVVEKIENFADDFLPCRSKVPSNSKSSVTASKAAVSQRLKRSLNEDILQSVPGCSSNAGKKIKTDENARKFGGKSDEIVEEFKFCEESLKVPSSKCEADFKVESVSSLKLKEQKNSADFVSEPPIDPVLLDDNFSVCSDEIDIFHKSPGLDDTVLFNSNMILGDSDIRANSDLSATGSCAESNSIKRKFSAEDTASLNLSQEISESASAFLFDMKNDNLVFDPVQTPSYSDAVDEPEAKVATPVISRSSSPVLGSSKSSIRKKYKKRRSQHTLSLNPLEVTYVRKEADNAADRKPSPDEVSMMFQNFAQRVNKRKEPSSNVTYPSSKKAKDSKETDNVVEQRKQAAAEQQKLVNQKDEQLCKPRMGSISAEKLHGDRKSLREMVNYEKPQRHSVSKLLQFGLKRSVVNVNADNASEFIFTADFLSAEGATYGDECIVVPNEKHEVYFEDLARAFLASPGVDPRLVSLQWIRNHYRWIIWKLASTEKSYPNIFGGRYLTLNNVLLQLKFRYDWEVDRCCRSALKRILECDSSPAEPMILCVASVKTIVASLNEYEMEMTDGWYSVPCLFDGEMLKLLTQKKVAVGTKLVITNAELSGAGDGCDPLQANQSARLKIATNSVRRARWYAPLGFYTNNPIVVSDLRAILPNGGTVPQFTAVIARVYPMLYLEKKDDGSFALQNEKVHFKKTADFEKRRQMCLDTLVSQITNEVEKENPSTDSDDRNTDSDPIAYQNRRYHEQERLQILIQERVKQKLPEEFKSPKRASSMLKVRLINKDALGDSLPAALLTIWHPPEDLVSLFSEGKLYEFHKIVASGLRNGEVQLTANRLTKYKYLSAGDLSCCRRRVTSFDELSTDFKAVFGEVDVVGLVISVKDVASDAKNDGSQTIYLADLNKNLMIVKFRTNVKDFGFEDTLKLKNVIAGLNLQWKRSLCNGQIPIVFASELTSFIYNSRCQHLQNCIDKFHSYFKNTSLNDFVAECEEILKDIVASPGPVATSTPVRSNQRPSSANENSATSEPKNDASVKPNNSADSNDACSNAKSKNVRSRIEKLRGYGEPPPLSPISMCSRRKSSRLSIQTRVHKLSINKT